MKFLTNLLAAVISCTVFKIDWFQNRGRGTDVMAASTVSFVLAGSRSRAPTGGLEWHSLRVWPNDAFRWMGDPARECPP